MEKENKIAVKEEDKKEKKVEVELNNRIYRIPEHTLEDAERLGATSIKKQVKNPPKELILPGSISELGKENAALKAEIKKLSTNLPPMDSEIDVIKGKLIKLGIGFHPTTGLDKLKIKLAKAETE